eukprot:3676388-Pleurochrysis_carterae.AAC.1
MEGRARRRLAPACSRLCMHAVAPFGDMMLTWLLDLETCMARQRERVEWFFGSVSLRVRVVTRHSNRPLLRTKGRTRRPIALRRGRRENGFYVRETAFCGR